MAGQSAESAGCASAFAAPYGLAVATPHSALPLLGPCVRGRRFGGLSSAAPRMLHLRWYASLGNPRPQPRRPKCLLLQPLACVGNPWDNVYASACTRLLPVVHFRFRDFQPSSGRGCCARLRVELHADVLAPRHECFCCLTPWPDPPGAVDRGRGGGGSFQYIPAVFAGPYPFDQSGLQQGIEQIHSPLPGNAEPVPDLARTEAAPGL